VAHDEAAMRQLGKLLPERDRRTLRLSQYIDDRKLRPIPKEDNNYAKMSQWTMAKNDELGCCVVSGAVHMIQVWSSMAAREKILPDGMVERTYFDRTGGLDFGLHVLSFLKWWRSDSIAGHPLGAFVAVNPTNMDLMKTAIHLFGGVYTGLGLPLSAQGQDVWGVVTGGLSSVPYSWGGHLTVCCQYDKHGNLYNYTWGEKVPMTPAFTSCYCDEAYALLSLDWFTKDHKTPDGLAWKDLKSDLDKIKRG
jgi:hypothetical protein